MLQAFVITLREGFEIFLIVAIALAYLKRSGRERLLPALYWGLITSFFISVAAGYFLWRANNQPFWEGMLSFVAAVLVASFTIYMWRTAKMMKKNIENRLESASMKGSKFIPLLGVFLFVVLMVTREGMETALMIGVLLFQVKSLRVLLGAFAGLAIAILVARLWVLYGHRINVKQFFQVTSIFLLVFVVQLLIYGVHELAEANLLPSSQAIHEATEPYGPAGFYGHLLTYSMVGLPIAWLLLSGISSKIKADATRDEMKWAKVTNPKVGITNTKP